MVSQVFASQNTGRPFWPRRGWWLVLLGILVLAGVLRYPGYGFNLPFPDQPDEVVFALSGRMIIDFGTAKPLGHHHYPPGIISIYYMILRLFHDPTTPPASVIWIVRLIAITTSLGVIAVIGLFGYYALGKAAGLFGAALWSITPLFVNNSRWGTAEIFVTFFSILALHFTFVGMRYRRESWTTHATYALMLAIVFKYHCVFLTPAVLFVPLWRGRISWRRVLANTGRFALFSTWFLLLTPVLESYFVTETLTNTNWVPHVQIREFPNPLDMYHNLRLAFRWFDWQILLPGWLGLLLIVDGRSRRDGAQHALVILFGALFLWLAGISLFGAQGPHAIRFLFAWVSLLVMLAGWGYALILRALGQYLARRALRYQRAGMAVALLLLGALFLPSLVDSVENLQWSLWADPRNFVRDYAAATLAPGRYIISKGTSTLFNRDWGNYSGGTEFEITSFEEPTDFSVETWREQGVTYAILHYNVYDHLFDEDPFDYLGKTTRLKGWEHQPNYRYTTMVVLRLYPIQHQATGQLGPIRLIGYDLPANAASAGQSFPFHLYWQATAATATDYQVFNHLLDAEGNLVAQVDGPPLPDPLLRRGSKDWDDAEEIIYSREYALTLPEDLPPGEYSLVTGFYRRDNGQRLLTPTGEDSLWVASISVE